MLITKNNYGINQNAIDSGYARAEMSMLNIHRYYNKEEMQANKHFADTHSEEEWGIHCEEVGRNFCKQLTEIMEELSKTFVFAQYNADIHAKEYDFFYHSNIGVNNRDWFDHVQLSINHKLSANEKEELFEKILKLLEEMKHSNLQCSISYKTVYDDERINNAAKTRYEEFIKGKKVMYRDLEGTVRIVDKDKYGFFKNRAKTHYYPLCGLTLLMDVRLAG